jgi:hypothetical protein
MTFEEKYEIEDKILGEVSLRVSFNFHLGMFLSSQTLPFKKAITSDVNNISERSVSNLVLKSLIASDLEK